MILDAEDRGPAWEVEDDLDRLDGGTSLRDLATHGQLRSLAFWILAAFVECGLLVWLAIHEATWTVEAVLLGAAVAIGLFGLSWLDRLACLLTGRWRCRECRGELERWSATDDREGAH